MSLDAGEQVLITPEKDDVWVFYHSLWTLFEKPRDPVTDYDSQEVISRSKRHFGSKFDRIARISGDKIWINCGPLSVHIAEEKLKSCFQDMQAAVGLLPEGLREKFLVQTVID